METKIKLPSGKVVTIRDMTTEEQSYLLQRKKVLDGKAINQILANCTLYGNTPEDKVDVRKLLVGDRYFLTLQIRILTYDEEYEFEVRCPYCKKKVPMTVNLKDIPVKFLEEGRKEDDVFDLLLPRSGKNIKFRLVTGEQEEILVRAMQSNKDLIIATNLFIHTVEVEGEKPDFNFFKKLNGFDSRVFNKAIEEKTCGVETTIECHCNLCEDGEEGFDVELPITETFFFPMGKGVE